jgi:hypothetical protein
VFPEPSCGLAYEGQERLPNGIHFAFGELLGKAPSNQRLVLLVGPDFVGFLHSGLAPWARRHPPSMAGGGSRGIHAARPTERDLRSACTQVAIGVVWAFGVGRSKTDQEQIKSRSRTEQTLRTCGSELAHEGGGTSNRYLVFVIKHSRASSLPQGGGLSAEMLAPELASSRLKPVLQSTAYTCGIASDCRTGFSREAVDLLLILIFICKRLSHRQTRLGCRLNGGLVEWAEPHGCGESAVRTWMSVRRGPTERDRSEGTPRHEGPNQEQALLLTFGAFQK